jgi:protein-S-isoprenylcysteine O-methyltransferase Ste14
MDPWHRRIIGRVVANRVRITAVVFLVLVLEKLATGMKPNSALDALKVESAIGIGSVLIGLATRSWAAGVLEKNLSLTTTGPYALVRNPLYVGSFLIMGGMMLLINIDARAFVVLAPLGGLYYLQIMHEETLLQERFGDTWRRYAKRVPSLVPRLHWPMCFGGWRLSLWIRNREFRALFAVLIGVVAIELWPNK